VGTGFRPVATLVYVLEWSPASRVQFGARNGSTWNLVRGSRRCGRFSPTAHSSGQVGNSAYPPDAGSSPAQ
jgi:hypothetical protein